MRDKEGLDEGGRTGNVSVKVKVLVAQSCPTLCNPMDYSPPGSSVHGISQARILECVPLPSSVDLPDLSFSRDPTHVSCIGRQILDH